jgi:hypothetical protein
MTRRPAYRELVGGDGSPPNSAWDNFGRDDALGCPALISPAFRPRLHGCEAKIVRNEGQIGLFRSQESPVWVRWREMAIGQVDTGSPATPSGQTTGPDDDQMRTSFGRILNNPVMGFAPWIISSVIEGPGRFAAAAGAAFGAALLILLVGVVIGFRAKLLDLAAIAFFAILLALGLAVGHGAHAWLERWSGEISNVMIVLVALGSVWARRSFTPPVRPRDDGSGLLGFGALPPHQVRAHVGIDQLILRDSSGGLVRRRTLA